MALQMALNADMDFPVPAATSASPYLSQSHKERGSTSVPPPQEPYLDESDEEMPIQGRPPARTDSDDSLALPLKGSHSYPSEEPLTTPPDSNSQDVISSVQDFLSGKCCVEVCILAILVTASVIISILRRC
ncbi:hypothetical protein PQX77_008688 [Marasmius sp. AFHP31]|nr:hypothetical protein PQX77_008688 [Marasmius sp. AFHP31]